MKAFAFAVLVGTGLFFLVAAVPHKPVQEEVNESQMNAKVDARLHQVLSGLLRAQVEQASLTR